LAAVFPLAIKHFNERDGRIIPQFASKSCNVSINLLEYVDDQGSPAPATKRLVAVHNTQPVNVIIGPVRSTVAQPVSVTANALEIPVLSHWATSPDLANKQIYQYFSRTCPSDDSRGVLLAELVVQFGFRKFGMIYVNDVFGRGWRNAVLAACEKRNVEVFTTGYDDTTGRTLERGKLPCALEKNLLPSV
jgi:ABC-type branched-subunit amino acid transport system substrate-binding protein